jgi:hypothetical protein
MEFLNDPQTQMMIASVVAPMLVKVITDGLHKANVVVPKPLKPVLSILIGALSAAVGDFSPAAGALAGVAGVGVREAAKPVSKKVAATVKK